MTQYSPNSWSDNKCDNLPCQSSVSRCPARARNPDNGGNESARLHRDEPWHTCRRLPKRARAAMVWCKGTARAESIQPSDSPGSVQPPPLVLVSASLPARTRGSRAGAPSAPKVQSPISKRARLNLFAQVRLSHHFVSAQLVGFVVQDDLAGLDDIPAMGDLERFGGILLDEQNRRAFLI